jgi:hypothetical protein
VGFITQGSSFLATLGWMIESFQDSADEQGGGTGQIPLAPWRHGVLAVHLHTPNCRFSTVFFEKMGF